MTPASPSISTLLNLVPTPTGPSQILTHLTTHPTLASTADQNGYTLLHAAASYNALDLLRALITTYHANPNVTDNDGDTPLFYAESVEAARCLVEELGADPSVRNEEGDGAIENARTNAEDGEPGWAAVASYLEAQLVGTTSTTNGTAAKTTITNGAPVTNSAETGTHPPPPLPPNIRMNVGTMSADELEAQGLGEADPEFRARIEALAARGDFGEASGQRDLRALIEEAVGGLEGAAGESAGGGGGGGKRRAGG